MSGEICLLGDSVAKGILYRPAEKRYVHSDCSFLRRFCEERGDTLLDHAKFGCTLGKAQRAAEKCEAEFARCRATFLMLGGNDCDYDWAAVAKDPRPDRPCNTPLDQFVSGYLSLLERIKKNGGHPIMIGMVPVVARQYYAWITGINGESGISEFLIHPEYIEHWNEHYNLALYEIAARSQTPLVDVRSILLKRREIGSFYCPDGIHPNEAGQELLYRESREKLQRAILSLKDDK